MKTDRNYRNIKLWKRRVAIACEEPQTESAKLKRKMGPMGYSRCDMCDWSVHLLTLKIERAVRTCFRVENLILEEFSFHKENIYGCDAIKRIRENSCELRKEPVHRRGQCAFEADCCTRHNSCWPNLAFRAAREQENNSGNATLITEYN